MQTLNQLKDLLRDSQHALFNYESSVNMLKGLKCKQADEMIDADREAMVDKLMELRSTLNELCERNRETPVSEINHLNVNIAV